MISLSFDFSSFERKAKEIGGAIDQIPFALANAMSSAAFKVREILIDDTWPRHVEVRNRNAIRQALRVEKAKKKNLRVAIVGSGPSAQRLNLKAHAEAGAKRPLKGRRLAIAPTGTVHRGARGVPKGERPTAIINTTPKRALRITDRGIFVGQGGRLHLRYAFTPTARIKADVPFHEDFNRALRAELRRTFPIAMAKAMKTRRR
jgi:hypothetical protein